MERRTLAGVRDALNDITGSIIGAAMEVHTVLGAGLLESGYRVCLAKELRLRGHHVEEEKQLAVHYKGVEVGSVLRVDLLIDQAVVVEVKAVSVLLPVHHSQVLSYLRWSGCRVGLLLNFHEPHLRDGIVRLAR